MSLWQEFKAFAVKGNVIDLAVAVVIGAAFSKIVTALVDGVVMPIVGKGLPDKNWQDFAAGGIKIGAVLGAVVDFLIVAVVLFIVVVKVLGGLRRLAESPVAPTTKTCAECLEVIPLAARRCRACTSQQPS
ncbi:MAG TPA: large conductance mechanosensitive channel protein MscL [Kofleriaceae bacterium]|nr:large conductance mechanosensitive channel protein MscL [Kofleriaceae bacterium]